jgi:predicted dehydrogenase
VLSSIVDPTPAARELAVALKVDWFPSFQDLLSEDRPEGIVVATPNQLHVANGMDCIAAGIPALIEKPLAVDVVAAQALVEASERAGVPLLTGHHRRHNPMIQRAKAEIDSGRLGQIVSLHGMFWLIKPDDYFDVAWRREKGAGPVFLNLIHELTCFGTCAGISWRSKLPSPIGCVEMPLKRQR